MKKLWRIFFILLLVLAAAVTLVYFSASSWLETTKGRKLLQRELGKSLGLEASLKGQYALQLFPGFQIAGEQLLLLEGNSSRQAARLDSYALHLALWPLLKKRVDIRSIEVAGGFLDLDVLQASAASQKSDSAQELQLPSIRSLRVSGLDLLQSGNELLEVDQLTLENFVLREDGVIDLQFSLPDDQAETSLVYLAGSLQLATSPLQLSIGITDLKVRVNDQTWPLGQGRLDWSINEGAMQASLMGQVPGYSSLLEVVLQTIPETSISFATSLEAGEGRSLSGKVSAKDREGLWVLNPVELRLVGQELTGNGCFSMAARPRLQLLLRSEALELDLLQDVLPAGLFAAGDESPAGSAELPIDLAIEVLVSRANYAGARASEARLLLGEQPNCDL